MQALKYSNRAIAVKRKIRLMLCMLWDVLKIGRLFVWRASISPYGGVIVGVIRFYGKGLISFPSVQQDGTGSVGVFKVCGADG